MAPGSSRGLTGGPSCRGIDIKQVKQGDQAEAEARFLCRGGRPEHPLLSQIRHNFLIKKREAEDLLVAPDAGAPGNVLRIGLTQVPPKFLIDCGTLVIKHG